MTQNEAETKVTAREKNINQETERENVASI